MNAKVYLTHSSICVSSIILALLTFFTSAHALDVIHLKNESVIKGDIIERNFTEKKYKIKTSDGSVFVYKEEEIAKITEEKDKEKSDTPTIIINNNNQDTINNTNSVQALTGEQEETKSWKIFFTTAAMDVHVSSHHNDPDCYNNQQKYDPYTNSYYQDPYANSCERDFSDSSFYGGGGFGFSYAINNHLSFRLSRVGIEKENNDDHYDDRSGYYRDDEPVRYGMTIAELVLASNTSRKGWNLYAGISKISIDVEDDGSHGDHDLDFSIDDPAFTLGAQYNFDTLFIGASITNLEIEEGDESIHITNGSFNIGMRL